MKKQLNNFKNVQHHVTAPCGVTPRTVRTTSSPRAGGNEGSTRAAICLAATASASATRGLCPGTQEERAEH